MNPLHILLAEDNPGDQILVAEALKTRPNVKLHTVSDGVKAVEFVTRVGSFTSAPRPSALILDYNLPLKSGPEVLRDIRSFSDFAALPIILFSGAAPTTEVRELCKIENTYYATKPDQIDPYFGVIWAIADYCQRVAVAAHSASKESQLLRDFLKN
jgi:CheY-like chemotaxis protein